MLPESLRCGLRPGPIEGDCWCIFVPSTAAANKLRQLLPDLKRHLQGKGLPVSEIRIKVLPT